LTFYPTQFQVAKNDVRINGAIIDVDTETGRAQEIRRVRVTSPEGGETSIFCS
jgi:calcineurin-like phosphoesterase